MGAHAALSGHVVDGHPGADATVVLTVTNTGHVVDAFALHVLGAAAQWTRCEPAELAVMPGESKPAEIVFAVPLSPQVPAGDLLFGVHVTSREDPEGATVAEGVLRVAPRPVIDAELGPRTSRARGRRRARAQVAVDNTGNAPATVQLLGADDQDAVQVRPDPAQVDVAPGAAKFVPVRIRGVERFWTGPPRTLGYRVEVRSADAAPVSMPGTLLHEAVVPRWAPRAILVLVAAAAALVVLWYAAFKPVVRDTATDAANTALTNAGIPTGSGSGAGSSGRGSGSGSSGKGPTNPPSPTPGPKQPVGGAGGGTPMFSLVLTPGSPSLAPTAGQHLGITDVVLQNPDQDWGALSLTVGSSTLIRVDLEDFQNYDLHFLTPIEVPAGSQLTMAIDCLNNTQSVQPPPPHKGQPCSASALIDGSSSRA